MSSLKLISRLQRTATRQFNTYTWMLYSHGPNRLCCSFSVKKIVHATRGSNNELSPENYSHDGAVPNSHDGTMHKKVESFPKNVSISGWVKSIRKMKSAWFVDINDGSCLTHLQVILPPNLWESTLSVGCSVQISGELKESTHAGQQVELFAGAVRILGKCDPEEYPFPGTSRHRYAEEALRKVPHLRQKVDVTNAALRLRSSATMAVHNYYQRKGFVHIHTPILTSNDCEGAGEAFKVTTSQQPCDGETIDKNRSQLKDESSNEFFGHPVYLSVSGQLHLEAMANGLGNVYTISPTFRADEANSRRHLAEFYMVEAELPFVQSLEYLMQEIEEMIKGCVENTIKWLPEVWTFIHKSMDPARTKHIDDLLHKPFVRMTYEEACDVLGKNQELSERLGRQDEARLVQDAGDRPVFITHFPRQVSPFYAKLSCPDGNNTETCDLLLPEVGEVVGGSLRETSASRLRLMLQAERTNPLQHSQYTQQTQHVPSQHCDYPSLEEQKQRQPGSYQPLSPEVNEQDSERSPRRIPQQQQQLLLGWYLQVRECGAPPSGGYGVGLDRLVQFLTGASNIRDVVAFPRWPGHCAA